MAGPPKKRAQAEKQNAGSSESQQSSRDAGYDATKRSSPASIPRLDGNRDPGVPDRGAAINYSKLTDLKNISEFMGIAGWCVARGVSTPHHSPSLISPHRSVPSAVSCGRPTSKRLQTPTQAASFARRYAIVYKSSAHPLFLASASITLQLLLSYHLSILYILSSQCLTSSPKTCLSSVIGMSILIPNSSSRSHQAFLSGLRSSTRSAKSVR
jgi:hypothetical protein